METPVTVSGVLSLVAAIEFLVIIAIAIRNIKVVEDNREITKDAISGFRNIHEALNAIRSQLQDGDNAIMGKVNDTSEKIHGKVKEAEAEILSHLQYLRDKAK